MSEADELLKFKELLDSGVITKEEFEKKKNEILNPEKNTKKNIEQNTLNKQTQNISNNKSANIKEPQKLGKVNIVVSWIFFAFFGLGTLGSLITGFNFATFIIYLVITLICCPLIIEKLQEKTKIRITTTMRVIAIFMLLILSGFVITANLKTNTTNTTNTSIINNTQQNTDNKKEQTNPTFVSNTNGKNFFQNVLCSNTQCQYREPVKLKADNMIPYDTITYTTGNDKYSFEVTTNTKNEIANIQLFFYKYGSEDPTDYFMNATKLSYSNSDIEQLTSFITNNIGQDEKIKIGDFTFHLFNGTSSNCVILDIYTDEFAKINGNL